MSWAPVRLLSNYPRVKTYRAGLGVTRHQGTTSITSNTDNPGENVNVKRLELVVVLSTLGMSLEVFPLAKFAHWKTLVVFKKQFISSFGIL